MDTLSSLNDALAAAVERAAGSVVQVQGHGRPATGVVFAPGLILAPATALDDDAASVRGGDGTTYEAAVLGRAYSTGLAVARVSDAPLGPLDVAAEPRVGHLALALGRTWSGNVIATVTNVAVVGGPLRTGRATPLDRVVRIAQPPHAALTGGPLVDGMGRALGVVTARAIRGTTVVIPAALAWSVGQQIAAGGGSRQGYLGISSFPVRLSAAQRGERPQSHALLVGGVVEQSPAADAGVLIGDVLLALDGKPVEDPETLLTLLRSDRIPRDATVTILRGGEPREVRVTLAERKRR